MRPQRSVDPYLVVTTTVLQRSLNAITISRPARYWCEDARDYRSVIVAANGRRSSFRLRIVDDDRDSFGTKSLSLLLPQLWIRRTACFPAGRCAGSGSALNTYGVSGLVRASKLHCAEPVSSGASRVCTYRSNFPGGGCFARARIRRCSCSVRRGLRPAPSCMPRLLISSALRRFRRMCTVLEWQNPRIAQRDEEKTDVERVACSPGV